MERHRADTYRRDPTWSWRTAAALRAEVARANPSWPTKSDRDADFAHHLQLRLLLDRAADAIAAQSDLQPLLANLCDEAARVKRKPIAELRAARSTQAKTKTTTTKTKTKRRK